MKRCKIGRAGRTRLRKDSPRIKSGKGLDVHSEKWVLLMTADLPRHHSQLPLVTFCHFQHLLVKIGISRAFDDILLMQPHTIPQGLPPPLFIMPTEGDAAARVFALPELLGHILERVNDQRTILLLTRVNHTFKTEIDRSPALQRQLMFIVSSSPLPPWRWKDTLANPMLYNEIRKINTHIPLYPQGYGDILCSIGFPKVRVMFNISDDDAGMPLNLLGSFNKMHYAKPAAPIEILVKAVRRSRERDGRKWVKLSLIVEPATVGECRRLSRALFKFACGVELCSPHVQLRESPYEVRRFPMFFKSLLLEKVAASVDKDLRSLLLGPATLFYKDDPWAN